MKRQRVSRACDTCRIKKDRCDGARPSCSTCSSLERSCSYNTIGKKRGVPTGYLRTLELLWGLVLSRIHGSEDSLHALLKSVDIPSQLRQISKDGESSNDLLATWKNSSVRREIERILSSSDQLETDSAHLNTGSQSTVTNPSLDSYNQLSPESRHWHFTGGISQVQENSSARNVSLCDVNLSGPSPTRRTRDCGVQTDVPPLTEAHAPTNQGSLGSDEPRELRLPDNARQLFDIYFTYTNSWFPVIEKHEILRTAFSYGTKTVRISPIEKGSGAHAALWAILTLASFQNAQKNDSQHGEHSNPHVVYRTARWLIPHEDGIYEPGHAQALLVLSLVKIGQQQWLTAWVLVGFSFRIAVTLGLCHTALSVNDTESSFTKTASGRSKHIILGCFVLDTLVATEIGCPSLLRKDDVVRIGPLEEDGLEEWHPWEDQTGLAPNSSVHDFFGRGPLHGPSTFNRLVSLTCILNDFHCHTSHNPLITDSDFADFESQIRLWASNLEKTYSINLDEPSICSAALPAPHILGLHLVYEGIIAKLALDGRRYHKPGPPATASEVTGNLKRLEKLLNTYLDNYGASAASPAFLTCIPGPCRLLGDNLDSTLPHDPRNALRAIATQLSLVWEAPKYAASPQRGEIRGLGHQSPNSVMTKEPTRGFAETRRSQGEFSPQADRMSVHRNRDAPIQPSSSIPWSSLNSSSGLSYQGCAPPLIRTTSSDIPRENPPRTQHQLSLPANSHPPIHAPDKQNQLICNDSSMNTASFAQMDMYDMARPTRIAPDLDALLDELDYLEGSDRPDQQPLFMRNLGFAPNSGVSELYSYSSQVDPFMLSPNTLTTQGASQEPPPHALEDGRLGLR